MSWAFYCVHNHTPYVHLLRQSPLILTNKHAGKCEQKSLVPKLTNVLKNYIHGENMSFSRVP